MDHPGDLSEFLESIRLRRDLPSLSSAVAWDGEVVWQAACGMASIDPARPAHPEMVYPLGSITKAFIATMLMQLVEQGVVRLEDPITTYLPEYRVRSDHTNTPPATLRQLAAHTAGLPRDAAINFSMNYSLAQWEFTEGRTPLRWYAPAADVLASLPTVELDLPPDTARQYSNLGVMLLGLALERVSGQNIRDYMAEHIFSPLGMTSAGFVDDAHAWDERFPTGYARSVKDGSLFETPRWNLGGAIYSGGIYATASDLSRFCAAFMPGQSAAYRQRILRPDSIRRMIHPAAMGDAHLGWWKGWHEGQTNFGHAGAHVGFMSTALFVPELKLAVAVQTNRWNPVFDSQDSTAVARELLESLIPWAEGRQAVFDPDAVDLTGYTGQYRLPGGYASVDVTVTDNMLTMTLTGVQSGLERLVPVGLHQFGPPGTNFPAVTFVTGPGGEITGLSYALFTFHRVTIPAS